MAASDGNTIDQTPLQHQRRWVYALLLQPPSATLSPDPFLSLADFLSLSKSQESCRNIPARGHFAARDTEELEDISKF